MLLPKIIMRNKLTGNQNFPTDNHLDVGGSASLPPIVTPLHSALVYAINNYNFKLAD